MKKAILYSSFLLIVLGTYLVLSYQFNSLIWGVETVVRKELVSKSVIEKDCKECERCLESNLKYGIFKLRDDKGLIKSSCVGKQDYMLYEEGDFITSSSSTGSSFFQAVQIILGLILTITIAVFLARLAMEEGFCDD